MSHSPTNIYSKIPIIFYNDLTLQVWKWAFGPYRKVQAMEIVSALFGASAWWHVILPSPLHVFAHPQSPADTHSLGKAPVTRLNYTHVWPRWNKIQNLKAETPNTRNRRHKAQKHTAGMSWCSRYKICSTFITFLTFHYSTLSKSNIWASQPLARSDIWINIGSKVCLRYFISMVITHVCMIVACMQLNYFLTE